MSNATTRPYNCRERQRDEGRPYPRSSCTACNRGIGTGLGTCPYDKPAAQYKPEDQALIDRVNAEHEAQNGKDRLWGWFGLSRAGWLTVPRVLMHEMPHDWQKRAAVLLEEFDTAFPNWCDQQLYVIAKRKGRFEALAEWLCNYRRPDKEAIDKARVRT